MTSRTSSEFGPIHPGKEPHYWERLDLRVRDLPPQSEPASEIVWEDSKRSGDNEGAVGRINPITTMGFLLFQGSPQNSYRADGRNTLAAFFFRSRRPIIIHLWPLPQRLPDNASHAPGPYIIEINGKFISV